MNNTRIIVSLFCMFIIIVSAMIWHFSSLQSKLINANALKTAELYSVALTEFRSLYTSEVVEKIKLQNIEVTHNYATKSNAIPLPATLSMRLGEEIGKHAAGAKAYLYSPYPFPWRAEEGESEASPFYKEAWDFLVKHPDQTFSRFETVESTHVLRFATADIMRPQCVSCHNNHADTPKNNWKVGDVRGILAISVPLDAMTKRTEANVKNIALAYITFGLAITLVIGLIIIKLRKHSQELQLRVSERTADLEKEVHERQLVIGALTEAEERNSLLLNSAGEGIYGLDEEGKTTFVNPAACKMLGYTATEMMGKVMHDLIHHSYSDGSAYPKEACQMYAAFRDAKVHRVMDEVLWRKDGTSFPVEYTSTPLKEEGCCVGAVIIFSDISQRRKVERMKDEFLSTVSHELRTPLTSIRGSLGLVVGGALDGHPEKALTMLKMAYENSNRLTLLINDLLDMSKLESGQVGLNLKPLNINELIKGAVNSNQGYADQFGIRFDCSISEHHNVYIQGDEQRLNQVLSNLLSNAIKYSPQGEVVRVKTSLSDDKKVIRIAIIDQGSGIPKEFQESVFEKFTQADSSDTRKAGGTGLGLAISKEIVEQHKGAIGFESSQGKGSIFFCEFPVVTPEISS